MLKLFGIAFAIVFAVYMAAQAFRNSRRLDRRIKAFKAEQAELEKRGGPRNPYQDLAELYSQPMDPPGEAKRSTRRSDKR